MSYQRKAAGVIKIGARIRHDQLGVGTVSAISGEVVSVVLVGESEPRRFIGSRVVEISEEAFAEASAPRRPEVTRRQSTLRPPDWSDDELDVLVAIFNSNEFSIGDDAREENHAMADAFRRSQSAVDRQWRNIADVYKRDPTLKVGDNVVRAVERYEQDPNAAMASARATAARNGWALGDLLH